MNENGVVSVRTSRSDLQGARRTLRLGHGAGGFSLVEMLVVLIIIGLVAALALPRLFEKVGKSRVQTTKAQLQILTNAVEQFRLDLNRLPTLQEGLDVLIHKPPGEENAKWEGPYLQKNFIPTDGWDNAFEYSIGSDGQFLIRSFGADKRPGGDGENSDLDNRNK